MAKSFSILLFSLFIWAASMAQTSENSDSIFEQSRREQKAVFMVFSGSDWCANCIRFEKQILRDSVFQHFLNSHLLYLNIDFPQRKKQPALLIQQNEALAEQYNPNGIFPTLMLCYSSNKPVSVLYEQETVPQFIEKLKKEIAVLLYNSGTQN